MTFNEIKTDTGLTGDVWHLTSMIFADDWSCEETTQTESPSMTDPTADEAFFSVREDGQWHGFSDAQIREMFDE